jgi:uncharacterized protein (DUF1810 family)
MTDDPYNLERFVTAQDAGGTYEGVVAELRRGHKTSHSQRSRGRDFEPQTQMLHEFEEMGA